MIRRAPLSSAVLILVCGCGTRFATVAVDAPERALPYQGPAAYLLAGTTDPSDEIDGPLEWDPETGVAAPPASAKAGRGNSSRGRYPTGSRDSRFGLFYNRVAPGSSGWEQGNRLGLFYRMGLPNRMPLELSVDLGRMENEDGSVSSDFVSTRAQLAFSSKRKPTLYPFAGLGVVFERTDLRITGSEEERHSATLDMGFGVGNPRGRWNVRFGYSFLPGSSNVDGEGVFTVLVGF